MSDARRGKNGGGCGEVVDKVKQCDERGEEDVPARREHWRTYRSVLSFE